MKQFQFEAKNNNILRKELARVKRFAKNEYYNSIFFQIFTTLEEFDEIAKITDIIEQEFPEGLYYGCQTFGNIFEGRLSNSHTIIVCSVFEFETTLAKFIYIDPENTESEYKSLNELWDYCNENKWVKGVELTASYKCAEQLGIGKVIDNLREEVRVFGGIAINPRDMRASDTYIFAKGHKPSNVAAMALLIGGPELHVETGIVKGWEGLGKKFVITSCEGKRIHTIDNEPAMNVYRRYLNIEQDENFFDNAILFPLLVEQDGIECIRVPFPCENKDEYDLVVNVERGMNARLSYGEKNTILKCAKEQVKNMAKLSPDTVKIYSGASRRAFWGDVEVSRETQVFDDIASTVGFYTMGEIVRIDNYLHYLNSTMVIAIVREGEALEYDFDLEKAWEEEQEDSGLAPKLINYIGAVTDELEGQYNSTMRGIANIYKSMFLIDMDNKELVQLDNDVVIKGYLDEKSEYSDKMKNYIRKVVVDNMLYKATMFCDFHSLRARLRHKNSIDCELVSIHEGWFRAQFIVVNRDSNGIPDRFVFTTQIIDEEKQKEERLITRANTDEMTALYNRRSYDEDILELKEQEKKDEKFAIIAIDINGLKTANDTLGHKAGDEMIVATATAIRRCISSYGKAYRTGGDEFVAIVTYNDKNQLNHVVEDFKSYVDRWEGVEVKKLSVSVGVALSSEYEDEDIDEIIKMADKRMYADKADYYKRSGMDRRGRI